MHDLKGGFTPLNGNKRGDPLAGFAFKGSLDSSRIRLNGIFIDYSPKAISGPQFSPLVSNRNQNFFMPLFTPRNMPSAITPTDVEEANAKMDNSLSHLKKQIDTNSANIKGRGRLGRGSLTIETDDQPPEAHPLPAARGLGLDIGLINDSFGSDSKNEYSESGLLPGKSPISTTAKNLPFSPNSLFIPRSKNNKAFS